MANVQPIRDSIASSEPVQSPPRSGGGGGGRNGGPKMWDQDGMPPGCRVRPVGTRGIQCIFLDSLDQLTFAGPRELGEAYITQYFGGDTLYLSDYWPRFDKDGGVRPGSFSPEDVRRCIQRECAQRGIWDDMDSVRGRGAWRAEDGSLAYHCGDMLISRHRKDEPGVHGRFVYPGRGRIMKPLAFDVRLMPGDHPEAAAWQVYNRLLTWNWKRGPLDARFFFGLMLSGFLGGALRWRPSGWVTGEAGSGKSYMQSLRREIMGGWSLNASDATSAGVFQHLEFDSIAVSLDEQESGGDNRKLDSMVELAREAASGDARLRGSAGHAGVSFKARSSFLFSSINMAPLKDQDMSRMVQMQLNKRDPKVEGARWTRDQAARWGAELLRVIMERWDRWDETLTLYQAQLAKMGHDQRGQDTFGTLLAMADMALSEKGFLNEQHPDDDPHAEEIWKGMEPATMPEYSDRTPNWLSCIHHVLSSRPRDWKTGGETRASIGAQIDAFLNEAVKKQVGSTDLRADLEALNRMLALGGVMVQYANTNVGWQLCVPNSHPQLSKIYEGTDWPGKANAPGGWIKAIKAGDEAVVEASAKFYIDGRQVRGVAIRLDRVTGISGAIWEDKQREEKS